MKSTIAAAGALAALSLLPAAHASALDLELIADTNPAPAPLSSSPRQFHRLGNEAFFTATRPDTGMELFAVGAAPGSERLVADLAPGGASSYAQVLGDIGGALLVAAAVGNRDGDDAAHAEQIVLLAPDGSDARVLTTLEPWFGGPFYSQRFERLLQAQDVVWFRDRADGSFWASNGTAAGTARLFNGVWLTPQNSCTTGSRLLFSVSSGGARQLQASDGSPTGTGVLVDFPAGSAPYSFAAHAGSCYFLRDDGQPVPTTRLWRSDGTTAGTQPVAAVPAGRLHAVASQLVVFSARDNPSRLQLVRVGEREPYWQGNNLIFGEGRASTAGQLVLSVQDTTVGGYRLLVTDASGAGTRLAELDGAPLAMAAEPQLSAAADFVLVRAGNDGYRLDAATAQVTRLGVAQNLFDSGVVALAGGVLVGNGHSETSGEEVWRSDGTRAGTFLLADLARATAGGLEYLNGAAVGQGNVLFYAPYDGSGNGWPRYGLWRSDGSAAGTRPLPRSDYDEQSVMALQPAGSGLLFATGSGESTMAARVYITSADFSSTTLVWEQGGVLGLLAGDFAAFFGCRSANRWNACGLPYAASQALPLLPGGNEPVRLLGSLGSAALLWSDGQLWRSDGTPGGTQRIVEYLLPPSGLSSGQAVRVGGQLYFEACSTSSSNSCGLYISDGTPAGTRQLRAIGWPIRQMAVAGGALYFVTDDTQRQLWRSDGSSAGTVVVMALQWRLLQMLGSGTRLHLLRNDPSITPGYLVSDGTAAGTRPVALPPGLVIRTIASVLDDGSVLLGCYQSATGIELCRAQADGSGVALVADLYPGPQHGGAGWLGGSGGLGYLCVDDGRHGFEPWRLIADRLFAQGFE